jgi:ribosomal protein S8
MTLILKANDPILRKLKISPAKLKDFGNSKREPKYHSTRTQIDGIWFDSKKEANRYSELRVMEKSGEISGLTLQPEYQLQPGFTYDGKKERAIVYRADFRYSKDGKIIVEDVKASSRFKTNIYKLKRKMLLYKYGEKIVFIETY